MNMTSHRKNFIDYVLFNYDFQDRVAIWILNFIKSHPVVASNIVFTDDGTIDRKLRIADEDSTRPTLMFEKGNTVTMEGEVIFHELNLNQEEPLLLQFAFSRYDARYDRVRSLETDIDEALDAFGEEAIRFQIDEALDTKDHARFIRLTDYLKTNSKQKR